MELEFFGAAGEVTGSCHILRVNARQVLLDCGLVQGGKKQEARNREPFPFDVASIDAVVLSHAHIDHSGRLPLLVSRGYEGPILAQNATKDLAEILLADSADLHERDAEYRSRKRQRQGKPPIKPLYTREDARATLAQLRGFAYDQRLEVVPGLSIVFRDAGHIMGSAVVELFLAEAGRQRKLVFSGDLGQYDAPILRDPTVIDSADLVLMESTYGNRLHRDRAATVVEIGTIIREAEAHRGNILVPAFAVGRSQEVLYMLGKHREAWHVERFRVFLDSPLAIEASRIYWDYPHLYDGEATKLRRALDEMPRLENLHLTVTAGESRVINRLRNGAIVIAGSGMCNGGRILHHLKHNLWREECAVIIVGYQARGSIGRRLVDGAKHIRVYGETIVCRARIHTVGGLSAHGDQADLARWYGTIEGRPPVCLVHGEKKAAKVFAETLKRKFGTKVRLPRAGQVVDLVKQP